MATEVHTHEGVAGDGDTLTQLAFTTRTDLSLSGSVDGFGTADIVLNDYSFFPMIHGSQASMIVIGHSTDGASADAPRFRFYNQSASTGVTYDVDASSLT